jgi:two-component system, NtrC family, sensor kinase
VTQDQPREGAGQHRVLIVDDDALVGEAVQRVLRTSYRVTFAQSATGAIGRLQGGARFDAIVCDLMMPGLSGFQLHAEILKIAPDLARRIVFLTGYAGSADVDDFVRSTGVRVLPKPFTRQELRDVVEELVRG